MSSREEPRLLAWFLTFCMYNDIAKQFMFVSVRVEFYMDARTKSALPKEAGLTGSQGHQIPCHKATARTARRTFLIILPESSQF